MPGKKSAWKQRFRILCRPVCDQFEPSKMFSSGKMAIACCRGGGSPKNTYLPLHCELCAAMGAHNCGTRWCWRLVTFDTLITILTIENLNSWQFLLYDHNEWQWTAFAILAMFFAKTGLSGSSIWWCWLVFDFLGIIFHLFWYPKWPKTSFANWATPPFWEKFPKNVVFLASQDALGVMLFTDWLTDG